MIHALTRVRLLDEGAHARRGGGSGGLCGGEQVAAEQLGEQLERLHRDDGLRQRKHLLRLERRAQSLERHRRLQEQKHVGRRLFLFLRRRCELERRRGAREVSLQLGGAVGERLVLLGRARVCAGVQREERLMASSTAHSRLANSQRVLGCSAGSACRSEAGMPGSCSYTPKHRAAVLLLWGRLREHAPGRAPRSRPSQAAGLQTDKHVRPKRKSGCATHAEAGRRAGPEDVEHGEHVELHEADEAARRLDRDGLNLAHLDAEYLPRSPQISPDLPRSPPDLEA